MARKAESNMWRSVRPLLHGYDPIRVENPACPGTPDVECTLGWIELKQEAEWPKRDATPLRVRHFTVQQRNWLRRRHRAGGRAWVLLRVGRDWLLIFGPIAATILGRANKRQLIAAARKHWVGRPEKEELIQCLHSPTD